MTSQYKSLNFIHNKSKTGVNSESNCSVIFSEEELKEEEKSIEEECTAWALSVGISIPSGMSGNPICVPICRQEAAAESVVASDQSHREDAAGKSHQEQNGDTHLAQCHSYLPVRWTTPLLIIYDERDRSKTVILSEWSDRTDKLGPLWKFRPWQEWDNWQPTELGQLLKHRRMCLSRQESEQVYHPPGNMIFYTGESFLSSAHQSSCSCVSLHFFDPLMGSYWFITNHDRQGSCCKWWPAKPVDEGSLSWNHDVVTQRWLRWVLPIPQVHLRHLIID